ncbi:MAG: hypothetical protein DRP35_10530 [Candidatus Zixiibacteriota bacterium]|nr:MAG: hypothetical protein DRP35_10530 [candidate division Zixibacteria bacterium]
MVVNYLAWLNIISLAVKLLNVSSGSEGIVVKVFTETTTEIHLSDPKTTIYHISLYGKETGIKLKGYILIPRQDIHASKDDDRFLFPFVRNAVFLTVNEFAVIYEEALQEPVMPKSKTLEPYIEEVLKILDVEKNNKPVEIRDNYTINNGIQVIKQQTFPQYVDLQVAKQGSTPIDYQNIKKLFPHKMILLSVIPDMGKVIQTWLSGGDADLPPAFFKIQDQVIDLFSAQLTDNVTAGKFEDFRTQLRTLMEKQDSFDQTTYDFLTKFFKRITLYESPQSTFSDYQPKTTPDRVTDFMPQIVDKIDELPAAKQENLKKLMKLFKQYQKSTKKNKGEWVEGNPLLGGNEKEYHPTEDELIFGEIGSRILETLNKLQKNNWQQIRKQQSLKNKKLQFTQFSFIHYDVMGSGRFFYVDKMIPVVVKFSKKGFEVKADSVEKIP